MLKVGLSLSLYFLMFSSYSQGFDYLPSSTGNVVVHSEYTFSYNEEDEQTEWVAYVLTDDKIKLKCKRTDDFREDANVAPQIGAAS